MHLVKPPSSGCLVLHVLGGSWGEKVFFEADPCAEHLPPQRVLRPWVARLIPAELSSHGEPPGWQRDQCQQHHWAVTTTLATACTPQNFTAGSSPCPPPHPAAAQKAAKQLPGVKAAKAAVGIRGNIVAEVIESWCKENIQNPGISQQLLGRQAVGQGGRWSLESLTHTAHPVVSQGLVSAV